MSSGSPGHNRPSDTADVHTPRRAGLDTGGPWGGVVGGGEVEGAVGGRGRRVEAAGCWAVLSRLEATPESASGTRFSATRDSVTNSRAAPAPMTRVGPSTPLV